MSFANANLPIQQFIDNYGNQGRTYQVLDFIRDVSNANNSVTLNPDTFLVARGKKRSVKLTYFPILCDVEGSCSANVCEQGEVVEPAQTMFDITNCTASKVYSINKDDIRLLDNNRWDFSATALQIINSMLPTMRRVLALDWTTQLVTMKGVHPDGNAYKRITVTNPATGVVNPIGRFDIEREYMDAGFMPPYILGGQEVYNWKAMTGIGGLNANGQRIDQLNTRNAYYDDGLLDSVLNDLTNGGNILTIAPETFKYVYYLENAGIFETDLGNISDLNILFKRGTETLLNGTLIDPVTNIPWDLDIYYSPCGKFWNVQIRHNWDFFQLPDVACVAQGVNGLMWYRTCPPVIATCPTGDTPSPAVAASTYNWNPGSIFPFNAVTSNIGGVENTQNSPVTITNRADLAAFMNDNYGASIFTVSGSNIRYSGYSDIDGNINGNITLNFA